MRDSRQDYPHAKPAKPQRGDDRPAFSAHVKCLDYCREQLVTTSNLSAFPVASLRRCVRRLLDNHK
jgi:hypothetical protein